MLRRRFWTRRIADNTAIKVDHQIAILKYLVYRCHTDCAEIQRVDRLQLHTGLEAVNEWWALHLKWYTLTLLKQTTDIMAPLTAKLANLSFMSKVFPGRYKAGSMTLTQRCYISIWNSETKAISVISANLWWSAVFRQTIAQNIPCETFLVLHQASDISSEKLYSKMKTCNLKHTTTKWLFQKFLLK